ncbi:MAG: hypothetical protein WBC33_02620 [Conexibacter sp.]
MTVTIGTPPHHPQRPWLLIGGSAAVHARLGRTGTCGESLCFVGRLAGHRVRVLLPGSA